MAGGAAAELAKALQLVHRHVGIAEQMQQPVKQHRAVPGRQHEAVAVGPVRRQRIEFQELREQHGGGVGHAHRHAGMAGIGLFDGVHRERAQRVRHAAQTRVGGRGERGCGGVHDGTLAGNRVSRKTPCERRLYRCASECSGDPHAISHEAHFAAGGYVICFRRPPHLFNASEEIPTSRPDRSPAPLRGSGLTASPQSGSGHCRQCCSRAVSTKSGRTSIAKIAAICDCDTRHCSGADSE